MQKGKRTVERVNAKGEGGGVSAKGLLHRFMRVRWWRRRPDCAF